MLDEFERLIPEFLSLARRIYDAGARAERDRLTALLSPNDIDRPFGRDSKRSQHAMMYGLVIAPVREALIKLAERHPEGIGAADFTAHFERQGGGPTEKQVRTVLNRLMSTREANRVSRGRYLPRSATTPEHRENSGGDAPELFNLVAGQLHN